MNPDARSFEGVKVQMGNGWPAALGEYENFNFDGALGTRSKKKIGKPSFFFDPKKDSGTLTPHTVNPNLDQLFVDQYKVWSCFRDTVTGFYCDGQSTTNLNECTNFMSGNMF